MTGTLVEGIITLVITAALFYVAPGVMGAIKEASPTVYATRPMVGAGLSNASLLVDPGLNASSLSIQTTAAGALNLSSVGLIMLGIGVMIGGFMLIRGRGNQ